MPIDPTGIPAPASYEIWMAAENMVEFKIQMASLIWTEGDADEAASSLVTHLSEWADLYTGEDTNYQLRGWKSVPVGHHIAPDEPS